MDTVENLLIFFMYGFFDRPVAFSETFRMSDSGNLLKCLCSVLVEIRHRGWAVHSTVEPRILFATLLVSG